VEALGQIGGTSARYLLEQALGDADAGVREAAQQMLEEPEFSGRAIR
jgi:HEAT repeat protein